jgi:SAM-dependent methyltransferase
MGRNLRTCDAEYTDRLLVEGGGWWKKAIDVQRPYRWNLKRLNLGFTLDLGCGLGRNLLHLGGHGVGIDHNRSSVEVARHRGLNVFLPEEFDVTRFNSPDTFDAILMAHVIEHMSEDEAVTLLRTYVRLLKEGGRVVLITPQERGFRSDPTHRQFTDFQSLRRIARSAGLITLREYSFPFPRIMGRIFKHNEFVSLSALPPGRHGQT